MIAVTTARVTDDPQDQYFINQSFALQSWLRVFEAVIVLGPHQEHLASPITRFYPSENFPKVYEAVDICADQTEWACIINSDIWVHPGFKRIEERLKLKKAVAASSWRWTFDPAVGVEPCAHSDYGIDFFAAQPGAWELVYREMQNSPQGEIDSPKHLRLGAPSWDQYMLGVFFMKFAAMGFYNLTDARCIRHPIHGDRRHYNSIPQVHIPHWPVMAQSILK